MTHPVRAAFLAGDMPALLDQLAPNVEIHGPALRYPIHGRAAAERVFAALKAELKNVELLHELTTDSVTILVLRARIGDRSVQWVDVFEHNEQGLVTRLSVYSRPLSGPAAFMVTLGPRLTSARYATAIATLSQALLLLTRSIERGSRPFVSQRNRASVTKQPAGRSSAGQADL